MSDGAAVGAGPSGSAPLSVWPYAAPVETTPTRHSAGVTLSQRFTCQQVRINVRATPAYIPSMRLSICTFRKWVTRNPVIPSASTADRGWVDTAVPLTRKRT